MTNPKRARTVAGTTGIETFSDGVLAIIVTLLILEIRVPQLSDLETSTVLNELLHIAPKFVSCAISFFTVTK